MVDAQHSWWFPEEIPDDPILYRAFESNTKYADNRPRRVLRSSHGGNAPLSLFV